MPVCTEPYKSSKESEFAILTPVVDKKFNSSSGKFPLPIFFPDATQGVVKTLDSKDVEDTKTPGVLVNTYHLYRELGEGVIDKFAGIGDFMNWKGVVISDSGGFQVMSLIKYASGKGKVNDLGITFHASKKRRILLTPEKSIEYQINLKTDLIVVLDDFTPRTATYDEAKETVERSIKWAERCKHYFEKNCDPKRKPYVIGVVQGGKYLDLRYECIKRLVKIVFDGLGYGVWPIT